MLFLPLLTPAVGIAKIVEAPVRPPEPPTAYELADRYFGDSPRMMDIIKCESEFSQYRASGVPKISNTNDVGIAQIHITDWEEKAKKMNLDIFYSTEDNLKMARWIYDHEGIDQWTCNSLI